MPPQKNKSSLCLLLGKETPTQKTGFAEEQRLSAPTDQPSCQAGSGTDRLPCGPARDRRSGQVLLPSPHFSLQAVAPAGASLLSGTNPHPTEVTMTTTTTAPEACGADSLGGMPSQGTAEDKQG